MGAARRMWDAAKHPRGAHGRFGTAGAKPTTRHVGGDRVTSRLAMSEAGIRYDYQHGHKQPRRYLSSKAVAEHGRHAHIPTEQAIQEDLQFARMRAANAVGARHRGLKAKRSVKRLRYGTTLEPMPRWPVRKVHK
jgi:hypothetical protein